MKHDIFVSELSLKFFHNNFYRAANGLTTSRCNAAIGKSFSEKEQRTTPITLKEFAEARSRRKVKAVEHRHKSVLLANMTEFMLMYGCNVQPPKRLENRCYPLYHLLMYSIHHNEKSESMLKDYPQSLNRGMINAPLIFLFVCYLVENERLIMTNFPSGAISPTLKFGKSWEISTVSNLDGDTSLQVPDWSEIFTLHFHLVNDRVQSMRYGNDYNSVYKKWNGMNDGKGPTFIEVSTYIIFGSFNTVKELDPQWGFIDKNIFGKDSEMEWNILTKQPIVAVNADESDSSVIDLSEGEEDESEMYFPQPNVASKYLHHINETLTSEKGYALYRKSSSSKKEKKTSKPRETLKPLMTLSDQEKIAIKRLKTKTKLSLFSDLSKKRISAASNERCGTYGVYLSNLQLQIEHSLETKFNEMYQLGKLLPLVCDLKNRTIVDGTGSLSITGEVDKLLSSEALTELSKNSDMSMLNYCETPTHDYKAIFLKFLQMVQEDNKDLLSTTLDQNQPEDNNEIHNVQQCAASILTQADKTSVERLQTYQNLQNRINPDLAKKQKATTAKKKVVEARDPFKEMRQEIKNNKELADKTRLKEMMTLFGSRESKYFKLL